MPGIYRSIKLIDKGKTHLKQSKADVKLLQILNENNY